MILEKEQMLNKLLYLVRKHTTSVVYILAAAREGCKRRVDGRILRPMLAARDYIFFLHNHIHQYHQSRGWCVEQLALE